MTGPYCNRFCVCESMFPLTPKLPIMGRSWGVFLVLAFRLVGIIDSPIFPRILGGLCIIFTYPYC